MKVQKITLHNFRVYKGENSIEFLTEKAENLTLIAGKNGFGKTTFLTSLVWAFYGKMMSQVEDKYRRDLKASEGYENYRKSLINNSVIRNANSSEEEVKCFVEIKLIDLSIPSIPCKSITIKREFILNSNEERLLVLIDGAENELTKEVGYETFINDFILPREIAKFFFFDAEKIVSLAEAKSKAELRSLSRAYSEVLGIKKYEELKKNLDSLLSKLRRNGIDEYEKEKLESLESKKEELQKLIDLNQSNQDDIEIELSQLRQKIDELQENLIRGGNSISVEELNKLVAEQKSLKDDAIEIKRDFKKLLELAPLVIAGKQLIALEEQLKKEQSLKSQSINSEALGIELQEFKKSLFKNLDKLDKRIKAQIEKSVELTVEETLKKKTHQQLEGTILLNFSDEEFRDFQVLLKYLRTSYKEEFERVTKLENDNKTRLSIVGKKIREAEARKDDPVAVKLRAQKNEYSEKYEKAWIKRDDLKEEFGRLNTELNRHTAVLSEYEKKFKLQKIDKKKYQVTENLLKKVNQLIKKIKEEKRFTLQKTIALGLKNLMHKKNFIEDVKVDISEEVMDVSLLDGDGLVISKENLSKGEQQLYATALLKALVDESGINFPVFIDSPLQKFDKLHSEKIIREFYPTVSDQVVLFPLLEKELSENEFRALEPNLNKVIQIENSENGSFFRPLNKNQLFPVA
ncbi:DNA sulfur modification protein DndD [Zunongwangia endophytica]|uniref:DNA sulfur modification protein DndD n=1 Tax=Zunongwangia endophytica TaxID=1808945 RepID=A0ABV8H8U6_9FLAO|nr:DNA sulfur modification protein DndD [Zunongwangia endophytica]MDN3594398.1 DNA sulfur modification protein DndD [Zunongwangia endophytica]